jgi:hypothetical protein
MPEDPAGAERELARLPAEPQTAEERRLAEALAELRQAAVIPAEDLVANAEPDGAESEDDTGAAKALEEDRLSSWVANTRASAVADAKAWEEDALKSWVAQARTDTPAPTAGSEPGRKASRRKTSAQKASKAKASRSSKPRAKRPKRAQAPEPSSDAMPQALIAPEPTPSAPELVVSGPSAFEKTLRSLRLALGWHWTGLLQRASPVARARRLGRRLWRLTARAARLSLRATMTVGKLPLRFVSDLDLPGLLGLLLAIAGVIAVFALLMRG